MKPILILSKAMKSSAWVAHGNMSPTILDSCRFYAYTEEVTSIIHNYGCNTIR